ncbi:tyrosine-type recombinase/integrase [Halomonas mongoliensis]|uniref:tyrosine-type recombinase/integrase n=1 Tax=Halomonas mongoliensis TaxID=321265 RepID=UPI00403AA54D
MEVSNAEQLVSVWRAEGNALVAPNSVADTEWVVAAIFDSIPTPTPTLSLGADAARHLVTGLMEHRKARGRPVGHSIARRRINRILAQMNALPGINLQLIPEPVQSHRPTALPTSSRLFIAALAMKDLDRQLLAWSRATKTDNAWLLVLAIRLMTRLGMSERVMLGTLSQLTLAHIDKSHRTLAIPSSPDASGLDDGHYRIALPDSLWVPMRTIMTREKRRSPEAWLFDPDDAALALPLKQRRKQLRRRLTLTARQLVQDHQASLHHSISPINRWLKLTEACSYVAVISGTPPLWANLLRHYPLPTCTPTPLRLGQHNAHHYSPGSPLGRLPDRQSRHRPSERDGGVETQLPHTAEVDAAQVTVTHPTSATRPAGAHRINTDHLATDWRRQVKNILQKFLTETANISKKSVKAQKHNKRMQSLLEKYENQLDSLLGFSGHYPAWVLHFLYHKLRTDGRKISTAKTYLSRLTPLTLLFHDAILDMTDWDNEVVLELEIAAREGSRWSVSTLEAFRGSMREFIRFCQQYGLLEDVTLPKRKNNLTPSILRTRILSPDHMQTAWEELINRVPNGATDQMKALVMALGFYGGMRASEIEALTLSDVQFGASYESGISRCWIDILEGKTQSARRRIALHIMAPPSVIKQLEGWIEARRQSCSDIALADIALFGPRHSPDAYKRRYLITLVIDDMRYRLGEDIDFHGLRHAAVSWTLLRLHAAQNPGFADTLQHRHHWMFQPRVLQETLRYFCGAEGTDTLSRGTVLLHVAKWIGHRDPATLLENYAHTLGLIHSDILAPRRAKNR